MARWLKNDFKPGSKIPHDFLNTIANFFNGFTVSESDTTGIQRQSDGRNTTILVGSAAAKINDTEGYSTDKNPDGRMTIELNTEDYSGDDDSHSGERQLRNVQHTLQLSSSVPFFLSTSVQGAVPDKISGELYWAQVDGKRYDYGTVASYKSLDVANDFSNEFPSPSIKGKYNLGLYGFPSSGSCTAPYSIHATHGAHTDKTLTWQVPVAIGGDPQATDPGTGINFVTFVNEYAGSTGPHYASFAYKYRTGTVLKGKIDYASSESALQSVVIPVTVDVGTIGTQLGYYTHTHNHQLLFWSNNGTPWSYGGVCTDHDPRYLHRTTTDDSFWARGNTTHSIALDITGKYGIDFVNGRLMLASGAAAAVDYKNCQLFKADGTKCVDYSLGVLYGTGYSGWATDTNVDFYVGVGGDFTVAGGNTSITGPYTRIYTAGIPLVDATQESGTPVVYVNNLRLMIGSAKTSWIGFEASAGQLRIVTDTGAELAKFTTGEP